MTQRPQRLGPTAYYGRRIRDYQTAEVHLAESDYRAEESLPFHAHANPHFCLVLSGQYEEQFSDRTVERRPGDLMFYSASAAHGERHRKAGRHFLIELGPRLARRWREAPSGAPDRALAGVLAVRLFAAFREAETGVNELEPLVEALVEAVRSPARRVPAWLREVESELRGLASGPHDLRELARRPGVHPVYLARAFREAYGCSAGEFLRRLRVSRAQRGLAREGARIADVAQEAGFCDQSHLNRVFKQQTGVTPGRFRALLSSN